MNLLSGLYLHDVFILNSSSQNMFYMLVELCLWMLKMLQWNLYFVLVTLIFKIFGQMIFNI